MPKIKLKYESRKVQIDKEIMDIIIELNNKGYKTVGCCQGHWNDLYNGYWATYIYFEHPLDIENYPPLYDLTKKRGKRYSVIEKNGKFFSWFGGVKGTREEKRAEHKELIEEIREWVERLEDNHG